MIRQQLNRARPAAPVTALQTFAIHSPHDRTVVAACSQVGCRAWAEGWETVCDERVDAPYELPSGQRVGGSVQAAYIRQRSGRTFRELTTSEGLTVFRFEPGQRCFAEHRTSPELYVVRDGDWRGNPTGRSRTHQRPGDWVEHFGENQQRAAARRAKG